MMTSFNNIWAFACVLAQSACGGETDRAVDAGGCDTAPSVTETGEVSNEVRDVVQGAEVCVVNRGEAPCVTTGPDGEYAVAVPGLPGDVDLAMVATSPGFLGTLTLLHETHDVTTWPSSTMIIDAAAEDGVLQLDAGFHTYPPDGTAFVHLRIVGTGSDDLAGMTAVLSPPSGKGPVYEDVSGHPNRSLTSTTSIGGVYFGNINPGIFEIHVESGSRTCSVSRTGVVPLGDWPSFVSGVVNGEAVADAITDGLTVFCD